MVDIYSFVEDTDFLTQKLKGLEDKVVAIAKQTVECALFIQEYTENGFGGEWTQFPIGKQRVDSFLSGRAVRNVWKDTDKKICDLLAVLHSLKDSFHGRLMVQSLFLSTKMFAQLDERLQGLGACTVPDN
jgi:hypothetical protein